MQTMTPEEIDNYAMAIFMAKIQGSGVALDLNEPYVVLAKMERLYIDKVEHFKWNGDTFLTVKRQRSPEGIVWDICDGTGAILGSFLQQQI